MFSHSESVREQFMKHHEKGGFIRGLGASLPIAVGYVPIAFSFGLVAVHAGLTPLMTVLISALIFAGASQFVLVSLLSIGAGFWYPLAVVLLMNSRHAFYGPTLLRKMSLKHSSFTRAWLAAGLTDEVFATSLSRLDRIAEQHRESWYSGLQTGAYAAWILGTVIGSISSAQIAHLPVVHQAIQFVLPALFMALLLEFMSHDSLIVVIVAAVVTVVMLLLLPTYQAMPIAMLVGALSMSWKRLEYG
ncbi:AzlC family ABC transporter permease [Acidithiobacillus sp. M4-SHS-6]|uniref:AzlC family ABC transporter permease n=1 Tax=Acidithiobacillus sp. M4-SHS-6 TaxID=3383024 RepID=UPI0039BDBE6C